MESGTPPTVVPFRQSGNADPVADTALKGLASVEAEQCLLGALLCNNRVYEHVVDRVRAEDFSIPVHARLFEAIGERVSAGLVADPIVLLASFAQDPALAGQFTASYLAKLVASVVTILNAPDYADHIADLARRRELIGVAHELIADACALDAQKRTATHVIDAVEQRLYEMGERATVGGPEGIGSISAASLRRTESAYKSGGIHVVDTGLEEVDRIISGMGGGDLVVIGGRPGMGKTGLAGTIVYNAARALDAAGKGRRSLYFSLEMTKGELSQRWLAGMSGIETDPQRHGRLSPADWARLIEAQQLLTVLPISVDDTSRLSVPQMRQRARRHKRRYGLDLIVVDHIQLVRQGGKVENRRLEIGDITSSLKAIAKELDVPVLALSQLSRAVEQREDKRPGMSDLRESGDIEQDSDVVMFIYREEYYLRRRPPQRNQFQSGEAFAAEQADWQDRLDRVAGLAEILISKNRHGREGTARVAWVAERQRFENLAH